jgi:hypothetical protein
VIRRQVVPVEEAQIDSQAPVLVHCRLDAAAETPSEHRAGIVLDDQLQNPQVDAWVFESPERSVGCCSVKAVFRSTSGVPAMSVWS